MSGTPPLQVLSIEDDPDHAELLADTFAQLSDYRISLTQVATWSAAETLLQAGDVDLLLLDYHLGATDGLTVLRQMHALGYDLPVIVLTSHTDAYLAAELTRAGCDHYLIKSDLTPQRLRRIVDEALDRGNKRQDERRARCRVDMLESFVSRLVESNAALAIDARIDGLTGLLNRAAWLHSAFQAHRHALRADEPCALLMIDVDYFKQYNDSYGHPAGDQCLRRIAHTLDHAAHDTDVCGRYGGEEFIVLCPRLADRDADRFAELLRDRIAEAHDPAVTASIGVATAIPNETLDTFIERADRALYRAKQLGRNQVCAAPCVDAA